MEERGPSRRGGGSRKNYLIKTNLLRGEWGGTGESEMVPKKKKSSQHPKVNRKGGDGLSGKEKKVRDNTNKRRRKGRPGEHRRLAIERSESSG